jgi:tetratricopeptide (TPR) repeat protein
MSRSSKQHSVTDSKRTSTRTRQPSSSGGGGPEDYWRKGVLSEVSREQIGFIAEGLFKELWARCGKDVAIDQVSLMISEVQFVRGFDLLYKIHDNEAALIEFQKSLKIRENILGRDHRDTGKTYCFVGHTLREQREYDSALGQYRSALRILVALLGKNHNHTKDVISCVDDVLKAKGLPDEDVSDYLTCLLTSMEHKRKGDELMETNGGDYDLAIQEYKQALIVEEISASSGGGGKYHPDTGEIYSKIGACLARMGDLKAACVEYGNALSIYAVTLGSDHRDTKDALKNIQNLPSLMSR